MEQINWENIQIEYIAQDFQEQEQNFSDIPSAIEMEQTFNGDQLTQEDYVVLDSETLIGFQEVPEHAFKNTIKRAIEDPNVLHFCNTCSLDFPSIAYLKRHYNTKKHQRAMEMQIRGRKFAQRRKYVRKSEMNPSPIGTVTDLTAEDKQLLNFFDEQLTKIQTENSAKNFYENFNFDLGLDEAVQTNAVPKSEKNSEIILDELLQSCQNLLQNDNQLYSEVIYAADVPAPKRQRIEEKTKHFCIPCNKTFNLKCHFTQHMNTVHAGDRKFKCQKCGKKYPEKHLLDTHAAKHFEQNKKFRCLQCPRAYNNKVDLKRHEKTHLEIRDHVCMICGNGFVRLDHLQKHYGVHEKRMRMGLGDKIRNQRNLTKKL